MGNPLQEQLLKAGLASKKQAKKAEHEKRISRKQNHGNNPAAVSNQAREEQAAKEQRNRELNLQRAEETRLRELKAQVKQLIETNRLPQMAGASRTTLSSRTRSSGSSSPRR